MKRIFIRLLSVVIMTSAFVSCGVVDMIEAERPVSYNSSNVYKDLKMDFFKGFVDKVSVEDLVKDHGKPDTILDADDVAAVEGYDIYQYRFEDGTIDCYVAKMATKKLTGAIGNDSLNMEALVDYIYYEPKKNIALKDFILNDSIRALIPTGKSVVYYFGDPFYNIVRIRLNKKNKNEILNVALNDVSSLEQDNDISEFVNEVNGGESVSLGDLGNIVKTEYSKKQLCFTVITNDQEMNLKKFDSKNPSWANIIAIRLFEEQCGIFRWMTDDIIREGVSVSITLVNEKDKETIDRTVDYSSFKHLFKNGFSNIDRLKAFTQFENLAYPYTIQNKMTCEKLRIEGNYLIIPFSFSKEPPMDHNMDVSESKNHQFKLLLDPENPERDNIALCYKSNYGIKKVFSFPDTEAIIEFTPDEVKKIMKIM